MVSDLPSEISLLESSLSIEYLSEKFGFVSSNSPVCPLFNEENYFESRANGILLIIKVICIGINWTTKNYLLFDSHSRNTSGA